jgi:hypothetical protein
MDNVRRNRKNVWKISARNGIFLHLISWSKPRKEELNIIAGYNKQAAE